MGILVPNYNDNEFGVALSEAYVAVATSPLAIHVSPTKTYEINTTYNIWASKDARQQDQRALQCLPVSITWCPPSAEPATFASMYDAIYASIKGRFPGYVDDLVQTPAPTTQDQVDDAVQTPASGAS